MSSLEEIRRQRLNKLKRLEAASMEPYPVHTGRQLSNAEVVDKFSGISGKKMLILAGRVMALRVQGAIAFFNFNDGTGLFQGLLRRGELPDDQFSLFLETVDIGDHLEVGGQLFLTKRGEKTILVKKWKMLSKSLRPLPEKWHGLSDIEERFRRRYLDLLSSQEVRNRFLLRSKIVSELRRIFDRAGFIEVETSILQPLAGGASAEPFKTHHNALGVDLYLRIAPELDLKKLLVGGFPKVYEIGRSFRNEGIDATHNPEFTTVEWYEAWSDAFKTRNFVEKIYKTLVKKTVGSSVISFGGQEIDFSKKFSIVTFYDLLSRHALISNPEKATRDEIALTAGRLGVVVKKEDSREKIMDDIFKRACRPKLVQPTFIVDYPADALPLAKRRPGASDLVDAFQLVIGGMEVVKAFSELNDPVDQFERFARQDENKAKGDREAQTTDRDFLEALEYGMPPAGGAGLSIDRTAMLLGNVKNIREVIFFPTLKPRGKDGI